MQNDTIAAISTPMGAGGISIIRISGSKTMNVLEKLFIPKNKKLNNIKSHTITYGEIVFESESIDEVLLMLMRAPKTYTREDVAEINCHGGSVTAKKILSAALKCGARLAEPGEFTKRAFLNGRINLSQAEAVIDLINAKTELRQKNAVKQLGGNLTKKIDETKNKLLALIANIETSIDYSESDIEFYTPSDMSSIIQQLLQHIESLLKTKQTGKLIREGIRAAIAGKPNAGKSSLLNKLLDEERAIVTNIPGTTRDTIEETFTIDGIAITLIDTAGIRESDDAVELIGITKAKKTVEQSTLILLILDGTEPLDDYSAQILKTSQNIIAVINKIDSKRHINADDIKKYTDNVVEISIKEDIGIDELKEKIKQLYFSDELDETETYITNTRHISALEEAKVSLERALLSVEMPAELLAIDLTDAYKSLCSITGETVSTDIIDKIFSEFCLGK